MLPSLCRPNLSASNLVPVAWKAFEGAGGAFASVSNLVPHSAVMKTFKFGPAQEHCRFARQEFRA